MNRLPSPPPTDSSCEAPADEEGRAFTFADAEKRSYLRIWASRTCPVADLPPVDQHGYDVIDPTTVNPEIGGMAGLQCWPKPHAAGMGIIIDRF